MFPVPILLVASIATLVADKMKDKYREVQRTNAQQERIKETGYTGPITNINIAMGIEELEEKFPDLVAPTVLGNYIVGDECA